MRRGREGLTSEARTYAHRGDFAYMSLFVWKQSLRHMRLPVTSPLALGPGGATPRCPEKTKRGKAAHESRLRLPRRTRSRHDEEKGGNVRPSHWPLGVVLSRDVPSQNRASDLSGGPRRPSHTRQRRLPFVKNTPRDEKGKTRHTEERVAPPVCHAGAPWIRGRGGGRPCRCGREDSKASRGAPWRGR